MITGKVRINGVDVKSAYGAYVVDGGYVDIPCLPSMKEPPINNWYEYDGIEIDLESPCCEPLELDVVMMMNGTLEKLDSFMSMLKSERYHTVEFVDIERTVRMRFVSVSARGLASGLFRITLSLSDDNPLEGLERNSQTPSSVSTGLLIDGNDISDYFMFLVGSVDGLWPDVEAKDNELHSSGYENGEKHFEGDDTMPASQVMYDDIRFTAMMKSRTFSSFWNRRDMLALDLFKPGEREISYQGRKMKAYYKGCRSLSFSYCDRIWWTFELTFGCISR